MYTSCRDRSDQAFIDSCYDDAADIEEQEEEVLEDILDDCKKGCGQDRLDFFSDSCYAIENEILALLAQTYRPNPNDEAIGKQVYALLSKAFATAVEERSAHIVLWRS